MFTYTGGVASWKDWDDAGVENELDLIGRVFHRFERYPGVDVKDLTTLSRSEEVV